MKLFQITLGKHSWSPTGLTEALSYIEVNNELVKKGYKLSECTVVEVKVGSLNDIPPNTK